VQAGEIVVIAAYNAEAFVARAIKSALAEPEAAEIIVVDDGSKDRTVAVAEAEDDGSGRLKVIRMRQNGGPSIARNAALAQATSDWVTVLDADDFMRPGRLGRLLAQADGWDFVADDLIQVDEGREGEPGRRMWFRDGEVGHRLDFAGFVAANVPQDGVERRELGFLKPLMSRVFLKAHRLSYAEDVRLGEDYDIYARALALGARFLLVPAEGYVSVIRAGSISGRHGIDDLARLRDVDLRLGREFALTARDRAVVRRHLISTEKRLQWRRLIAAVKQRDVAVALSTFGKGWQVSAHLMGCLFEQAVLRARGERPLDPPSIIVP
jgi:succinoglycan biosynthesis protein ExoU